MILFFLKPKLCDKKLVDSPHKTNEQGEVNFQPIFTYSKFLMTICEWANDRLIQKQTTQAISLHIVPTCIDILPKLCGEKLIILCPHWHFAKIVWWKTYYFVPILIDVLPKLCDEKLVSSCPHWLMFCQNCVMKNLLVRAHIDWCFAKIVWWKTC
jgi:hypothetical protein